MRPTFLAVLCATAFGVVACNAKQEAPTRSTLALVPVPSTALIVDGAVVTLEEWEDCAAAAKAHEAWVTTRIPTDSGRALASKQAVDIQTLCASGKWPKGTVDCFDNATSGAASDKCAEKLSQAQKQAVSDLFTEILSVGKAAAIGSGSAT